MVQNMPDSEILDVREYLFVDRQRVGSLLSQFSDGLPQERNESFSRTSKLRTSLTKIFSSELEHHNTDSHTLALADLHVSQLEETAEALGMLGDASRQFNQRKHWLRGKVRKKIEPGMLLRVSAATQITDVNFIVRTFQKLYQSLGKASDSAIEEVIKIISSLYGDSITVSIRPVDTDDHDDTFVGEIPSNFEFGPMRKELLLSQIGPSAVNLTTLFQVASVPTEKDIAEGEHLNLSRMKQVADAIAQDGTLDRRQLDQLITILAHLMAEYGFVSAPRWPSISIIPLAIYRTSSLRSF